jgi:hypothetical protein
MRAVATVILVLFVAQLSAMGFPKQPKGQASVCQNQGSFCFFFVFFCFLAWFAPLLNVPVICSGGGPR